MTSLSKRASTKVDSSIRPLTQTKKRKIGGHTKNSMSTHVKKKENYFYTQEDQIQGDTDEFPPEIPEPNQRKTDHMEKIDDDSSLYMYKEYKKIYFDDPKQKKNNKIIESNYSTEQNKYTKLINTHLNKGRIHFVHCHIL